jgi:hypothetical protein
MKTCIGFVRARNEASAWKPCGKHPLTGEMLCADHRDGLDSALLGIMAMEQRATLEKRGARRISIRVGHAKCRGGKSRRPSGSNRTRQPRVPLPLVSDDATRREGANVGETVQAVTQIA